MRIPHRSSSETVGINMTPMIDVTFQLIIFFLVSSHLAQQEVHLPLPLPVAGSGTAPPAKETPRLTINVLGPGLLLWSGKPIRPEELRTRLEAKRAETGPDLEVRIRSDRQAAYRYVEPILLACARAGVWNVTFAVYRPEDVR